MKGNPKFKYGDKVIVNYQSTDPNDPNNGEHIGEIYIVDPFGCLENDSDVSYDVMIHDYIYPSDHSKIGDCLMKHYTETALKAYVKNDKKV